MEHGSVLLDLTEAFDFVDRTKLLFKAEKYGKHGTALNLFTPYLNERCQSVDMHPVRSKYRTVTCVVPQSSIPGHFFHFICE